MAQRRLKAKYRTVGPKRENVTYTKAWLDDETKSLQQEKVTEEMDTWMVFFPNGSSIRFCGPMGRGEMKRMGYDIKPKLVDLDTGDVVEIGGDPYDFQSEDTDDTIVLDDSEEGNKPTRNRTKETA